MRKLDVLIAGSTGYIGVQLVKLLLNHPNINIKYLCGNSSVGKNISFFDKDLKNKKLPNIVKLNTSYFKQNYQFQIPKWDISLEKYINTLK